MIDKKAIYIREEDGCRVIGDSLEPGVAYRPLKEEIKIEKVKKIVEAVKEVVKKVKKAKKK